MVVPRYSSYSSWLAGLLKGPCWHVVSPGEGSSVVEIGLLQQPTLRLKTLITWRCRVAINGHICRITVVMIAAILELIEYDHGKEP